MASVDTTGQFLGIHDHNWRSSNYERQMHLHFLHGMGPHRRNWEEYLNRSGMRPVYEALWEKGRRAIIRNWTPDLTEQAWVLMFFGSEPDARD